MSLIFIGIHIYGFGHSLAVRMDRASIKEFRSMWLILWRVVIINYTDLNDIKVTLSIHRWITCRDAPIWEFWPIPIILYILKPITDMLADKSTSKFVYTFWEPDKKKKVSSLKATSQTLQHKQPRLNSVSLKTNILLSHFQIYQVSQIKSNNA